MMPGPEIQESQSILDAPDAGRVAVRGGVVRLGGYAAGVALTIGSAALLFRHLGVVDSGRYVTVLALTTIVAGITEIGLTTIGMRELAVRDAHAKTALMRNLLGLRLVLTAVGVAAAVGFAAVAGYDSTMVVGTLLTGIAVAGFAVQSTLGISLMVDLRLGWVTALDLCRQTVLVIGIVALVAAGAGLLPFLAMQLPAAAVALTLTAWVVRSNTPLLPSFHPGEWRQLIREILPFAAATIVVSVYFRAAIIVLDQVSTPTETGYFGASFRITETLLVIPNLIVGTAFPIFARAARDDRDRLAYGVERVFQAAAVLGGALLVALAFGAPLAIEIVAGPEFAPSADVLKIQSVAVALSFTSVAISYALLSLRMHRALLWTASSALVVDVALVWILGSSMGANGAAIGTLVAELAATVVAALLLWRAHPTVLPDFGVLPKVGLALLVAAPILLIPDLPAAGDAALGVVVYCLAILALRAVPTELLQAIRRK